MQTQRIVFALLLFSALIFAGCCGQSAPEYQQPAGQPPAQNPPQQNAAPPQTPSTPPASYPTTTREEAIPADAVKLTSETDMYPPILHSDEFETPVPMPGPINTRGAEDSPFMMPDGNTFYVFFTPDVKVPVEQQLFDNVTGIYVSHKINGEWTEPERMWLVEPGKLALDGCQFVQDGMMMFCSAREGYADINLFTARYADGRWADWQYAGDTLKNYEVGEMHISADGSTMYFHSGRAGGQGQLDIWTMEMVDGHWAEPVNFGIMNSPDSEGWPYISQDGNEFWFTRFYMGSPALFRSKKISGEWTEPELIVSQFAGEPTFDNEGNLYFTHHFFEYGEMLEADIYVAYKK